MSELTIKQKRSLAGRKGGLAKRGTKSRKTLLREEALRQYRDTVAAHYTEKLLTAQLTLALGQAFLYRAVPARDGTGKRRMEIVTDPATILGYLQNREKGECLDISSEYFFITTKEPNNTAIEAIMNRVYGKPKESIDITASVAEMKVTDIKITVIDELPRPISSGNVLGADVAPYDGSTIQAQIENKIYNN